MRHQFLRKLFYSYLAIIIISATVFTLVTLRSLSSVVTEEVIQSSRNVAVSLATLASDQQVRDESSALFNELEKVGKATNLSVLLVSPSGEVQKRFPSTSLPTHHVDFLPDVKSALSGTVDCYVSRDSVPMVSCSAPFDYIGGERGAMRVSQELKYSAAAWGLVSKVLIAAFALSLIGALVTRWFAKRMTYPFKLLQEGAERFAKGELDFRLYAPGSDEMGRLARVLNKMAGQLQGRIKAISRNRNELDVVLASMQEGIIAISVEERVMKINHAACEMLDVRPSSSKERSIEEVLRNIHLQNFAKRSLNATTPQDDEIILHEKGQERTVRVYSRELLDGDGSKMGIMVALNDVTQLKHLESVRRDFVANVSHELKTPVTSIKGFVETLLDGALHQPDESRRFLGIIKRQVDRLNEIFDDLLSLARLEEEEKAERDVRKETISAAVVCSNVVQTCNFKARERKIEILQECDSKIAVSLNPSLAEQALVNLVDNAVKYSPDGTSVKLAAIQDNSAIRFDVIDQGPGIDPVHVERIFERFYRVDQGRSRQHGGTGLGLAIVKHIAVLHGGSVSVKSEPGKGSVFSISFPI